MNYEEQINRIKTKLISAKEADKEFQVFGSRSHKYDVYNPVSSSDIEKFEAAYSITLPECYKSFITHIGIGAGPYYGLWEFDADIHLSSLLYDPQNYLSVENSCLGYSYSEWQNVIKDVIEDDIDDGAYEKLFNELFAGILPIGTTGCTGFIGLILVGKNRGRIAHLSQELYYPFMTFDDNFLDWYERWLDEIISGKLIENVLSIYDF